MKSISEDEVILRMKVENPWWLPPHDIDAAKKGMPRRQYFDLFFPYVTETDPRRALVLMGPRRVGKTVMLHQAIQQLIDDGVSPSTICYLDLQIPLYNGFGLEALLKLAMRAAGFEGGERFYILFDEIQYLPKWEVHLKTLVDAGGDIKFIASGSAAAALRLKSVESGAGRFTDFLLPPVTFFEYMHLKGLQDQIQITEVDDNTNNIWWDDIEEINRHFVDYINAGGYPEAIFSAAIRSDPGRYIRSDIVDKVLMKDLPSLYGIDDIQELNSLFTMLAYNTGNEVSLDSLSQNSGVSKNTIKRYMEYLESAFLLKLVHRVDRSGKRFTRANFFKVYLTNPCIRSALFSPLSADDPAIGHLVETAVFSQWFHSTNMSLYYARWDAGSGEVDIVRLRQSDLKPSWALEVKWSDNCVSDPSELCSLRKFIARHPSCVPLATTRTADTFVELEGVNVTLYPTAIYCFNVGFNVIRMKRDAQMPVSCPVKTA